MSDKTVGCDGQPIEATLRQWIEAIHALPGTSWSDAALWNGGCISDDLKIAADEIKTLQAANAKLRDSLKIGYDAMKSAIGKCQATVDQILTEHEDVAKKRLAIFRDLDIPLAQVGCTIRASNEALATVDERIAAALADRTMTATAPEQPQSPREPDSSL